MVDDLLPYVTVSVNVSLDCCHRAGSVSEAGRKFFRFVTVHANSQADKRTGRQIIMTADIALA